MKWLNGYMSSMALVQCYIDSSLPQTMGVETSEIIKPDLCYWYNDEEVLQIEVDSKDSENMQDKIWERRA